MLHTNEQGNTKHINPVQYVRAVPSRRNALIAFEKIVAKLQWAELGMSEEVALISDFLKSR